MAKHFLMDGLLRRKLLGSSVGSPSVFVFSSTPEDGFPIHFPSISQWTVCFLSLYLPHSDHCLWSSFSTKLSKQLLFYLMGTITLSQWRHMPRASCYLKVAGEVRGDIRKRDFPILNHEMCHCLQNKHR